MSIALLCPTRARPEQCRRMLNSIAATSDEAMCAIAISEDENSYDYPHLKCLGNIKTPDGMPTVHKWNLLAQEVLTKTESRLFMLGADDMVFTTPCWDQALIDHYDALENKIHVYHLRDSRDANGTPHPIVTREYIEAMGYFMPPIFLHWFVDSWTVEIAKANSCFTHLKDYELLHDKPSDRGQPDETHTRIRSMGWHERDTWVNKHSQHFLELEKSRLAKHFKKLDFNGIHSTEFVAQYMDL